MVLYLTIIIGANLVLALANMLGFWQIGILSYLKFLGHGMLATVAVIAVDGIFALAIRRLLPAKLFGPNAKIFHVSEKERKFLKKLKIASWKDKIPELGGFTAFHKDQVREVNSAYLKRFIVESNYGMAIHIVTSLLGFLITLVPLWLPFLWRPLTMALPIAIVNFIMNNISTLILRYNLPPLHFLYKKALKREAKLNEQPTV